VSSPDDLHNHYIEEAEKLVIESLLWTKGRSLPWAAPEIQSQTLGRLSRFMLQPLPTTLFLPGVLTKTLVSPDRRSHSLFQRPALLW
jgi:hypothetical protein